MARVFLSYSRKDESFVDRLATGLSELDAEVTRDTANLMAAAEWRKQLEQMIAAADTIVFVVSPDSIISPECAWEIDLVEKLHKRLAPIIWRPVENDRLPPGIAKLQYVDFSGDRDFTQALRTLVKAIDTDIDWLADHTRLGEMARRWDTEKRPRSAVLRGAALEEAERWIGKQPKAAPQPTILHREFITASRRSATGRLRTWIGGSIAVTVLSLGLAVAAYIAQLEAIAQAEEAKRQRTAAESAQSLAQTNEAKAVVAQRNAEDNLAGQSRLLAQISEDQTRAGNSANAITLALKALPRDLSKPDRRVVNDALVSLSYAIDQDRRLMTLAGHANAVLFATYSTDGAQMLTVSSDKTARLWDARTGELIREIIGAEDAVIYGAFSPDGSLVATSSGSMTRVSDGRTGRPRYLLQGHTKNVQRIEFSPDGTRIVTGAWDNTARIWDAATGELLHVLQGPEWDSQTVASGSGVADPIVNAVLRAQTQIFGGMDVVAISPDGTLVATGGRADPESVVRLWSMATGKLVRVLRGPSLSLSQSFLDLAFSPDGSRIASALGDNTARVWNVATGDQLLVLKEHTNSVQTVRFSRDGKRILTGSMDGSARIWDATSGKTLVAIHGHQDWVNAAEFSPDQRLVLTASSDKGLKLWDAATGSLVADLVGHQERVLGAKFSPDGKYVLAASRDKTASVWSVTIGAPLAKLEQPASDKDRSSRYIGKRSVVTSQDRQRVFVSATSISQIGSLIDARTGTVIAEVEGEAALFVGEGRPLLTFSSAGGGMRTWSVDDGRLLQSFPGVGVGIDRRRRLLASKSAAMLTVSDLETGNPVASLAADDDITTAVMSDDGMRVVTASDAQMLLWQVDGARRIAKLGGLEGNAVEIVMAPRGERVAAVSGTGAIALWSTSDGRAVRLVLDRREEFTGVQFSGDGKLLRGIRRDGGVAVWRSSDGSSVVSLSRQPLTGAPSWGSCPTTPKAPPSSKGSPSAASTACTTPPT
jgi:WD40 repeat protein